MVKTVAIITARGGSKRIPGKNIKEFCGKPIIAYSIQAALDSLLFDAVMVSTDDEKIADVARSLGAEVPFMRSEKTSNDFATIEDAQKEVIENYHKQGEEFELACNISYSAFYTSRRNRCKNTYRCLPLRTSFCADQTFRPAAGLCSRR